MNNNSYTTGAWLGIVREDAVVALEAGTDPAIVNHLWAYLGGQPTIDGILHEVTEQFGTSLAGLPSFAIILRGERLHAILRGDIDLAAHAGGTTELVSGRDVATWSERSLDLPEALELTLAADSADIGAGEDALVLPVAQAVVQCGALFLSTVDAGPAALFGSTGLPEAQAYTSQLEYDGELPADVSGDASAAGAFHEDENYPAADFDEDFAMAAHAADAEWNAQLAPVGEALSEHELALTIRPEDDAEEGGEFQEPGAGPELTDAEPDDDAGSLAEDFSESGDTRMPLDEDFPDTQDPIGTPDVTGGPDTDASHVEAPNVEAPDTEALDAVQDRDDDGFTTNYDFLFGATVTSSVADAAVRTDDDVTPGQEDTGVVVPPLPLQPPLAGASNVPDADARAADAWDGDSAGVHRPETALGQELIQAVAQEPAMDDQGGGTALIDSVPWSIPAGQFPVDAAPAAQAAQASAAAPAVATPALGEPQDPDHDGHTILREHLTLAPESSAADGLAMDDGGAAEAEAPSQPVLASRTPTGPMVLARVCPNGHANPPSLPLCAICGEQNLSEPREVSRPRLGRMHISTGEVIDLDHALIIGRQPSVSRVMGEAMPRLVQVKSSNGDISRSHVEVRPDGWDVLLVDLGATNGTVLVREGQAPRRLGQGEEAMLLNGDIAELGDGVSLLFDGLL